MHYAGLVMRAANRWLLIAVCTMGLAACSRVPTTALVHISAPPATLVHAIYASVAVASQPPQAEQQLPGPVQLPGTLVVWLPDVAERATISLRALTSDGRTLRATVIVQAVPYAQVEQSATLSAAGGTVVGVTVPPDAGPPPSDFAVAPPVDMGSGVVPPGPTTDAALPPNPTGTVIAEDTFQRANHVGGWGTASDGNTWGGDAQSTQFSINNNTGLIFESQNGSHSAVLGPSVADADVVVTAAVSVFSSSGNNNEVAPMLRWIDDNNFYKAGIDGSNFRLFGHSSTSKGSSTLATMAFAATPATLYTIRFRVVGTSLMAKVWPTSQSEPANWMLTVTDSQLSEGNCGIRMVFHTSAAMSFSSFVATAP
jgi:hypothetical protein